MEQERKNICDCQGIDRLIATMGDNFPIRFDKELREYNLFYTGNGSKGYWRIYYCQFCGGALPPSRRDEMFAVISEDEKHRLLHLVSAVSTVEETKAKFGEPDEENAMGICVTTPQKLGEPEVVQYFKTMTYKNLSPVANVIASVQPPNLVTFHLRSKHLGKAALK